MASDNKDTKLDVGEDDSSKTQDNDRYVELTPVPVKTWLSLGAFKPVPDGAGFKLFARNEASFSTGVNMVIPVGFRCVIQRMESDLKDFKFEPYNYGPGRHLDLGPKIRPVDNFSIYSILHRPIKKGDYIAHAFIQRVVYDLVYLEHLEGPPEEESDSGV